MKPAAECIVIVDYNLTRVDDVRAIAEATRRRYGMTTILIRHEPSAVDYEIADRVVALDPRGANFVARARAALAECGDRIRAVLPFSDNAVQSGAALAAEFGLVHDSVELARAAYSKLEYRALEWRTRELFRAQGVFVPRFARVTSLAELREFAAACPSGFVLKPACEGNNRGVLRLGACDDLAGAYREVGIYEASGVLVEEVIPFEDEYSVDGVGELAFITQKLGACGRYPVERGQIVPAREPGAALSALSRAGTLANWLCGRRVGPFHNEVKLDPSTLTTAVVEPNRRPAGMRIWHLARRVYGLDFFELWVDALLGKPLPAELPPARGTAAIRMLRAPRSGTFAPSSVRPVAADGWLREVLAKLPRGVSPASLEWHDFRLNVVDGAQVTDEPRDNSEFMAQVCLFCPEQGFDVVAALDAFEDAWFEVVEGSIQGTEGWIKAS